MQSKDRSVYDTLLQLDETAGLIQSKNGIILLIAQHEAQLNLGGCKDGSAFALLSEHAANPGVAEEVDDKADAHTGADATGGDDNSQKHSVVFFWDASTPRHVQLDLRIACSSFLKGGRLGHVLAARATWVGVVLAVVTSLAFVNGIQAVDCRDEAATVDAIAQSGPFLPVSGALLLEPLQQAEIIMLLSVIDQPGARVWGHRGDVSSL